MLRGCNWVDGKAFFQQCHCTAALTESQLQAGVWVLCLQVKMRSFGVTDHYPSLRTLCLEKVKNTDTNFRPIDEVLSKWESNLVDSAVGFQSHWNFRAIGLWHNCGQISSPCAMVSQCIKSWSQYLPPSVRSFGISWDRELWKSLLLRFIHYLAKSENLIEANYGPLSLASLFSNSGSLKTML